MKRFLMPATAAAAVLASILFVPAIAFCQTPRPGTFPQQSGAQLEIKGTVGTTNVPIDLIVYDSQIHSGNVNVKTVPLGAFGNASTCNSTDLIPTDAYVLQSGAPTGCDPGDAFEGTLADGQYSFTSTSTSPEPYQFNITTHYQCALIGSSCDFGATATRSNTNQTVISGDTGFLTVSNGGSTFNGTITLKGSPAGTCSGYVAPDSRTVSWTGDDSPVVLALSFDSSGCGGFTAASQPQTITQGQTAVYPAGADNIKFTPSNNTGGASLTITPVPILQSTFDAQRPLGFSSESCVPYKDFSETGVNTCVEFQADCLGTQCPTIQSEVITNYDLPPTLNGIGAIGGPDFLVFHFQNCPPSPTGVAQSIFTEYGVNRLDPYTKGTSSPVSCYIATYTPGAPLITAGTVSSSQFVGFQSPVSDTDVNLIKAGSTVPLKWQVFDTSGSPITDLTYCADTSCTGNWVNLSLFSIACATDPSPTTIDATVASISGFQNLGGGSYQYNWKTLKGTQGCVNIRVTFSFGLVVTPAQLGFKYK